MRLWDHVAIVGLNLIRNQKLCVAGVVPNRRSRLIGNLWNWAGKRGLTAGHPGTIVPVGRRCG